MIDLHIRFSLVLYSRIYRLKQHACPKSTRKTSERCR